MIPEPFDPEQLDSLWNYDDPAASEARFRERAAAAPPGSAEHAEILTQLARSQGLQKNFDGAHATLDLVQESISPDTPRLRARYLLERGRAFNSSGQKDRSRPLFLEAWEEARAAEEGFYAVDAAHMLAIVGPEDQTELWNSRALELAEASAQPRARNWLGSLYNNIGWALHGRGDYDGALDLFQRALKFREVQGKPGEIRIARWCVARTLRSLGRVEEALGMQEALGQELEAAGEPDGFVHEELAECLHSLGRVREARPHFARAYELLSKDPWLPGDEPTRLERLGRLGAS